MKVNNIQAVSNKANLEGNNFKILFPILNVHIYLPVPDID